MKNKTHKIIGITIVLFAIFALIFGNSFLYKGTIFRMRISRTNAMPDLVIDSITLNQDSSTGIIYYSAVIRNAGTASVTENSSLRISVQHVTATGAPVGPVWAAWRVPSLSCPPLSSSSNGCPTFGWTLTPGAILLTGSDAIQEIPQAIPGGVTGIRLTIDSGNSVTESTETNNTRDAPIPAAYMGWTTGTST